MELKNISKDFNIVSRTAPATEPGIDQLKRFSPVELPLDYLDMVRESAEIEIFVGKHGYIRFWNTNRCIELNEEYFIQQDIPKSLAIGDDGGGGALLYCTGSDGFGLYILRFENMDELEEEGTFIAPTMRELLVNGEGVDVINYDD